MSLSDCVYDWAYDIGDFSGFAYAAMAQRELAALPDDEREAAEASGEWHAERFNEVFTPAAAMWAQKSPDPAAFAKGFDSGVRRRLRMISRDIKAANSEGGD